MCGVLRQQFKHRTLVNSMAYDKKEEYEAIIQPLVKKLMAECDRLSLPAYFSCAVADDGKNTQYMNDIVSSVSVDRTLANDLFPKYALVYDGFNVVPYNDVSLIEEEMRLSSGGESGSGRVSLKKGMKSISASAKSKDM